MNAEDIDGLARGKEVAAESLEDFRSVSKAAVGDEDVIFREGLEHLIGYRGRFAWRDICELYRRAESMMLSIGVRLEDWAKDPRRLPLGGAVGKALSVVASPQLLYTLGNRFGLERTFSHLNVAQKSLPGGQIWIEIEIPEPYEVSPEFFRFTSGVLQGLPLILGLELADVAWSMTGRQATYVVTPPQSTTMWSRLGRMYRSVFASRSALQELVLQQKELNFKHQELKAAYDQVSAALEVRQRFLRVISHEIRTPLNGITGASSALRAERHPEDFDALIDVLQRSSSRLTGILGEVLDFVAVTDDETKATPSNVDLVDEFRLSMVTVAEDAKRKGLELRTDVASGFPRRIVIDGPRLVQAAQRLLDNAVKFTDCGRVTLGLRFEPNGGQMGTVEVEVADTGPGIAAADHERIFEMFTQGDDSSTRRIGGTGVGLAIVRKVVTLLEGDIRLESALGKGSRFIIRVPARLGGSVRTYGESMAPRSGRVLVVDDDRINRMLLRRIVSKQGYAVDLAEDGVEAVAMVEENQYGLVFMDCEMPRMDGWEATRTIRRTIGSRLPIIAATAYVSSSDRKRCEDAGMNEFLPKPLSVESVLDVLQRCFAVEPVEPPLMAPRSGRVLVVDDDRINRLLLRRIVSKQGYAVDLAEDGVEAVAMVEENQYDLVFMDCEMPRMDGWEATRTIRRTIGSRLPIVAATAYVSSADRKRCEDAGMNEFLPKPLSVESVLDVLHRCVALQPVESPLEPSPEDAAYVADAAGSASVGTDAELW